VTLGTKNGRERRLSRAGLLISMSDQCFGHVSCNAVAMKNRPRSVTVISLIFIAVGIVALTYHLLPQHIAEHSANELLLVCAVRVVALLCGVFMLFGFNWARWLLIVWLGYHVILSAFHSPFEVTVHGLLFGVIAFFLFRPRASAYFRGDTAEPPHGPSTDVWPVS
jgi:hypothetical protein